MTRPLRIEFAGALYHVTARGDGRENIYLFDDDRLLFLSVISDVCTRFNWCCHAYCLMSNHYHLLIETPDANLAKGMRHLNGVYTQRFNREHKRVGHVFQGRYKAILIEKQTYLLELARYIVLNPVRAKMVGSAQDWVWSSYQATVGQTAVPSWLHVDWILAAFGARKSTAIRSYVNFIAEGKGQPCPWDELKGQIFLGSDQYVIQMQKMIGLDRDLSEVPITQRRPLPRCLTEYASGASDRDEALRIAYESGGYSMKEIGEHFGIHYSRVSRILAKAKGKT